MASHFDKGTYNDTHQRAAELHDAAAHAHRVAENHGQGEHATALELSRQASEHSQRTVHNGELSTVGHGIAAFGHHEIEALAHDLWVARGAPLGSPEEDWHRAVEILRSRSMGH